MDKLDWSGCPLFGRTLKIKRSLELLYHAFSKEKIFYSTNKFNLLEVGASGRWSPEVDGACGFAFNWFCHKYMGKYIAVDLDLGVMLGARDKWPKVVFHHMDGVQFFRHLPANVKMEYLYLDGPAGHEFALRSYESMKKNLSDFTLIVLDDIYEHYNKQSHEYPYYPEIIGQSKELSEHPDAKGKLIVPAMLKDGWIEDGTESGASFVKDVDFSKPSSACQEIFYTKKFKELVVDSWDEICKKKD